MILVELALQGVRGFPPQVRMGLKPGLNVFRSNDANIRGALVDGIYHSLFPDPARGSATAHLVGGNPSRIALTFFGRDKITYRVLREAQNGATKLYKFDPQQNQYELFTEVAQEVAQYIRVQQRIPDEVGYERLFMFTRETMPSKGVKGRTRSGAAAVATSPTTGDVPMFGAPPRGMTPTGFGSSMNMTNALVRNEMEALDLGLDEEPEVASGGSIEDKHRQLAELKDEYQAAFRAEQAQAEIDQLAARRFELTEKGERVKKIEVERTRLMELFEKESVLRSLPIGFAQRIEKFDELQKKHDAEMARAQQELAALQGEESGLHVVALQSDPYFLGGAIGAVAFFALAIWMSIPWLAWLNVLSMVVAAGGAFRFVGELEQKHKLGIRIRSASDRVERLERQFGDDSRQARDLMRKLEIDTPQELLDRIRGYEKLQNQIRVANEALDEMLMDPEIVAAKMEIEQIGVRVEALEGEVLGATSSVSAETLRKRIQALEREIGPAPRTASGAFFPPPAALPRPDSFRTGDIPKVEPFAPAGAHRRPAPPPLPPRFGPRPPPPP
jgi:hypothetical protein